MRRKKVVIFFIAVFLALAGLSFSADVEQKIEGFTLNGYGDNGQKAWDVKGDTANMEGSQVILTNVNANTYGEQKVNITADKGKLNQVKGDMILENDVVITNETGERLMTDSLHWNKDRDLVSTEDNVIITNEGVTVTGTGMNAHPGLKNAQINKNVTVMVDTEPDQNSDKFVTITCDGPVEIDQAILKATFKDNVVASQEGRILKADKMEVHFSQSMKDIIRIECIGHVLIEQGENKTYADKATYDAVTKKVTLSGRPKLIFMTEGENAFTALGN
ncbi:MAG: LPS export ABC transporter periplasmic protein LptC [Candidatus Omnitrophica bacterium]|nr:LPS export ABC transporter periplasmic protein LptC [Candidatus Omnitrophota bacterium]